jgi:hypothetical protein
VQVIGIHKIKERSVSSLLPLIIGRILGYHDHDLPEQEIGNILFEFFERRILDIHHVPCLIVDKMDILT